jgi:hypothetical protein
MSVPLDKLEAGFLAGAIAALQKAADRQCKLAAAGTANAGEKFPGVVIRSPEAARAAHLTADWIEIAGELAGGAK